MSRVDVQYDWEARHGNIAAVDNGGYIDDFHDYTHLDRKLIIRRRPPPLKIEPPKQAGVPESTPSPSIKKLESIVNKTAKFSPKTPGDTPPIESILVKNHRLLTSIGKINKPPGAVTNDLSPAKATDRLQNLIASVSRRLTLEQDVLKDSGTDSDTPVEQLETLIAPEVQTEATVAHIESSPSVEANDAVNVVTQLIESRNISLDDINVDRIMYVNEDEEVTLQPNDDHEETGSLTGELDFLMNPIIINQPIINDNGEEVYIDEENEDVEGIAPRCDTVEVEINNEIHDEVTDIVTFDNIEQYDYEQMLKNLDTSAVKSEEFRYKKIPMEHVEQTIVDLEVEAKNLELERFAQLTGLKLGKKYGRQKSEDVKPRQRKPYTKKRKRNESLESNTPLSQTEHSYGGKINNEQFGFPKHFTNLADDTSTPEVIDKFGKSYRIIRTEMTTQGKTLHRIRISPIDKPEAKPTQITSRNNSLSGSFTETNFEKEAVVSPISTSKNLEMSRSLLTNQLNKNSGNDLQTNSQKEEDIVQNIVDHLINTVEDETVEEYEKEQSIAEDNAKKRNIIEDIDDGINDHEDLDKYMDHSENQNEKVENNSMNSVHNNTAIESNNDERTIEPIDQLHGAHSILNGEIPSTNFNQLATTGNSQNLRLLSKDPETNVNSQVGNHSSIPSNCDNNFVKQSARAMDESDTQVVEQFSNNSTINKLNLQTINDSMEENIGKQYLHNTAMDKQNPHQMNNSLDTGDKSYPHNTSMDSDKILDDIDNITNQDSDQYIYELAYCNISDDDSEEKDVVFEDELGMEVSYGEDPSEVPWTMADLYVDKNTFRRSQKRSSKSVWDKLASYKTGTPDGTPAAHRHNTRFRKSVSKDADEKPKPSDEPTTSTPVRLSESSPNLSDLKNKMSLSLSPKKTPAGLIHLARTPPRGDLMSPEGDHNRSLDINSLEPSIGFDLGLDLNFDLDMLSDLEMNQMENINNPNKTPKERSLSLSHSPARDSKPTKPKVEKDKNPIVEKFSIAGWFIWPYLIDHTYVDYERPIFKSDIKKKKVKVPSVPATPTPVPATPELKPEPPKDEDEEIEPRLSFDVLHIHDDECHPFQDIEIFNSRLDSIHVEEKDYVRLIHAYASKKCKFRGCKCKSKHFHCKTPGCKYMSLQKVRLLKHEIVHKKKDVAYKPTMQEFTYQQGDNMTCEPGCRLAKKQRPHYHCNHCDWKTPKSQMSYPKISKHLLKTHKWKLQGDYEDFKPETDEYLQEDIPEFDPSAIDNDPTFEGSPDKQPVEEQHVPQIKEEEDVLTDVLPERNTTIDETTKTIKTVVGDKVIVRMKRKRGRPKGSLKDPNKIYPVKKIKKEKVEKIKVKREKREPKMPDKGGVTIPAGMDVNKTLQEKGLRTENEKKKELKVPIKAPPKKMADSETDDSGDSSDSEEDGPKKAKPEEPAESESESSDEEKEPDFEDIEDDGTNAELGGDDWEPWAVRKERKKKEWEVKQAAAAEKRKARQEAKAKRAEELKQKELEKQKEKEEINAIKKVKKKKKKNKACKEGDQKQDVNTDKDKSESNASKTTDKTNIPKILKRNKSKILNSKESSPKVVTRKPVKNKTMHYTLNRVPMNIDKNQGIQKRLLGIQQSGTALLVAPVAVQDVKIRISSSINIPNPWNYTSRKVKLEEGKDDFLTVVPRTQRDDLEVRYLKDGAVYCCHKSLDEWCDPSEAFGKSLSKYKMVEMNTKKLIEITLAEKNKVKPEDDKPLEWGSQNRVLQWKPSQKQIEKQLLAERKKAEKAMILPDSEKMTMSFDGKQKQKFMKSNHRRTNSNTMTYLNHNDIQSSSPLEPASSVPFVKPRKPTVIKPNIHDGLHTDTGSIQHMEIADTSRQTFQGGQDGLGEKKNSVSSKSMLSVYSSPNNPCIFRFAMTVEACGKQYKHFHCILCGFTTKLRIAASKHSACHKVSLRKGFFIATSSKKSLPAVFSCVICQEVFPPEKGSLKKAISHEVEEWAKMCEQAYEIRSQMYRRLVTFLMTSYVKRVDHNAESTCDLAPCASNPAKAIRKTHFHCYRCSFATTMILSALQHVRTKHLTNWSVYNFYYNEFPSLFQECIERENDAATHTSLSDDVTKAGSEELFTRCRQTDCGGDMWGNIHFHCNFPMCSTWTQQEMLMMEHINSIHMATSLVNDAEDNDDTMVDLTGAQSDDTGDSRDTEDTMPLGQRIKKLKKKSQPKPKQKITLIASKPELDIGVKDDVMKHSETSVNDSTNIKENELNAELSDKDRNNLSNDGNDHECSNENESNETVGVENVSDDGAEQSKETITHHTKVTSVESPAKDKIEFMKLTALNEDEQSESEDESDIDAESDNDPELDDGADSDNDADSDDEVESDNDADSDNDLDSDNGAESENDAESDNEVETDNDADSDNEVESDNDDNSDIDAESDEDGEKNENDSNHSDIDAVDDSDNDESDNEHERNSDDDLDNDDILDYDEDEQSVIDEDSEMKEESETSDMEIS